MPFDLRPTRVPSLLVVPEFLHSHPRQVTPNREARVLIGWLTPKKDEGGSTEDGQNL